MIPEAAVRIVHEVTAVFPSPDWTDDRVGYWVDGVAEVLNERAG